MTSYIPAPHPGYGVSRTADHYPIQDGMPFVMNVQEASAVALPEVVREPGNMSSFAITLNMGRVAVESENPVEIKTNGMSSNEPQPLVLAAGSHHPLMGTLDRQRAKFVRDMGWMPSDHLTDFDRYDSPDRWTRSFVETVTGDEGDELIVSSFRLTKVNGLSDCMSLGMVSKDAVEKISDEHMGQLTSAANDGVLYDLTRLLPPSSDLVTKNEYLSSVVRLIGHAIEHTVIESEKDPVWVFATTSGFHAVLSRLGITNQVIASEPSTNPGGRCTALCYVRPLAALDHVLENRDRFSVTAQNVLEGIDRARLTPVN